MYRRGVMERMTDPLDDVLHHGAEPGDAEGAATSERRRDRGCKHEADRDDPGSHAAPGPDARMRPARRRDGQRRAIRPLRLRDDPVDQADRHRGDGRRAKEPVQIRGHRRIGHATRSRSEADTPAAATEARKAVRARTSSDSNAFTFIAIRSAAAALLISS